MRCAMKMMAVVAVLSVGGACALIGPSEGERLLKKGLEQAEAGQTQRAIRTFKEATHTKAGWTAWNNLGVCYMRLNQHAQAVVAYSKALEQNPRSTIARFNRGVAFLKSGKLTRAENDFEMLLARRDRYAPAWNNLGVVLLARWRYVDAWKAFRRAVKYRPNYLAAWNNLSAAAWYLGRNKLAREALQKALALNPTYRPALKNQKLLKMPAPRPAPPGKKRHPRIKPDTVITEPGLQK